MEEGFNFFFLNKKICDAKVLAPFAQESSSLFHPINII